MNTDMTADLKVGDPDDPATLAVHVTKLCCAYAPDGDGFGICTRLPHETGNHAFGNGIEIRRVWDR